MSATQLYSIQYYMLPSNGKLQNHFVSSQVQIDSIKISKGKPLI